MLSMPEGALTAWGCDLSMFPDPGNPDHIHKSKMVSLFQKKRMKGYWPFYNEKTGERKLSVRKKLRHIYENIYVKTIEEVKYWKIAKSLADELP